MDLTCSVCQQKGGQHGVSNREINQKLLTLLEQPSCLTVSRGELENRVFPQVFVHRKPIRRRRLRSRDSHVSFSKVMLQGPSTACNSVELLFFAWFTISLQLCQRFLLLWLCIKLLGNVVRVYPRIVQGLTFLSA